MVNYFHTRSSAGDQSKVDQMRVHMLRNHPLMETICRCIEQSNHDVIDGVVTVICELTKRAVSTLTKVSKCSFSF